MTHVLRVAAAALLIAAAGCGSSPSSSPTVPTVKGAATASSGRRASSAEVAAAVRCIRSHGIPSYQDPAITPDGTVFTDVRSFESAPASTREEVQRSCRALMARARLDSDKQPPAPPALVRAGVRLAQCARAHGMPAMRDPNASSPYTPGHGFGLDAGQVPAGGKQSPGFQSMREACRAENDAMMKASSLASLGGHGS